MKKAVLYLGMFLALVLAGTAFIVINPDNVSKSNTSSPVTPASDGFDSMK